uniref:Ammonium transporter AmtB-like domain-containing protein n=1 Tax=Alexandrium andersonii TaxID=327968 RepID=A0A7S2GQ28_9DINO|mmetsp:Transcript_6118/g.13917  ORF Transcript_6118/g.13917 Transcript_6118/m.13917 type:complete len:139 (+) Transcript_6118:1-417(+)
MGGFVGTVLLGVLARDRVNPGTADSSPQLLLVQLGCAIFVAAYSFGVTFALLTALDKIVRIRPSKVVEGDLDKALHGEVAYVTHQSDPNLDLEDGYLSNSDLEETSMDFDRQSSEKSWKSGKSSVTRQPGHPAVALGA